jgi:hypothetical protein
VLPPPRGAVEIEGVWWRLPDYARGRRRLVAVDVAALDASWRSDTGFYIAPGCATNTIGDRCARFRAFLHATDRGRAEPIYPPEVGLHPGGFVSFGDGRHRFAVLRDGGVRAVAVSVAPRDVATFRQRFGT